MAAIDYGCLVFKNGSRYKENELYPYIDELDVQFYKTYMFDKAENNEVFFDGEKYSYRITFNNILFRVKKLCDRVYTAYATHEGNRFSIVFGYGIDNNIRIWNKCKIMYLGKTNARKVDNWIRARTPLRQDRR